MYRSVAVLVILSCSQAQAAVDYHFVPPALDCAGSRFEFPALVGSSSSGWPPVSSLEDSFIVFNAHGHEKLPPIVSVDSSSLLTASTSRSVSPIGETIDSGLFQARLAASSLDMVRFPLFTAPGPDIHDSSESKGFVSAGRGFARRDSARLPVSELSLLFLVSFGLAAVGKLPWRRKRRLRLDAFARRYAS
jgi:hypothetical protein